MTKRTIAGIFGKFFEGVHEEIIGEKPNQITEEISSDLPGGISGEIRYHLFS